MSLATAGGGLGGMGGGAGAAGGGLTMAHQANAMAIPTANNLPPGAEIPGSGGMAPPMTNAALGADLVDKSQQISLKQVKDLAKMPLVAIDLYANEPHIASFPPKPTDAAAEEVYASLVGKMKDRVVLKATESSHKTFRKWLSKSKGYSDLQADVLGKSGDSSGGDDKSVVVIQSPQKWLGLRRLKNAPQFLKESAIVDESDDNSAIAEESSTGVGAAMANGSMDGSPPQGDDFDRVVYKVRLSETKKSLTVLPEEMLQLLLNQAQHHVANKRKTGDEDEDIVNYPCAVALPAVFCNDPCVEALLDATSGTGVVFQRSVAALTGALLPSSDANKPNMLIEQNNRVLQARHMEFQKLQVKNPDLQFKEDLLILLCGVTSCTVECTAIEISAPQTVNQTSCGYGNFKVLTNVSYRDPKPEAMIGKCISELFDTLDAVAPEAGKPVGMVSYGMAIEQKTIHEVWEKQKKGLEDWENVQHFYTKPDAVAMGTAVLGAVSHGRLSKVVEIPGKKKPKVALAMEVQNVAPVAVGIMMNYHGGKQDKWLPPKTIFDFDRRVPAGPYEIDLNAAECAVYQTGSDKGLSEEQLVKAIKDNEGSKYIPKRETAALGLRVQIVQKCCRDGDEWMKIGNVMSPLVMEDKDNNKTACERIGLQLSLAPTGLITKTLVGDRESVVQATKSARNSAIRWYLGVLFAILFFGGFLVKSYWEEHVFERDTKRLLAYYKNVIPGSLADGDQHNARYLVWKYRGKKEKLWRSLEKKYGEPVLEIHEWPEPEESPEGEEQEEPEDLDDSSSEGEGSNQEEQDL